MNLRGAQRSSGIGREERITRTGGKDHDAPLLQMAHRATADVGLGHLGDPQRRLHSGGAALLLSASCNGSALSTVATIPM